ncbi:hypothetical protein [Novipirellula artificiosorum]|uniref:Neutral/alkaline non-lysosomal ceramidase n=1 Tax=Novipirellula artificiosorum TaxID=2528016 RepID=A0A5C6D207_9BACT|nr:hypothetical protein [Novipirellula artificiosorum]TWU28939.1 Neutral/alkaline non-lysosomal ceramidase [Novipirellula artificiosorum]
MLRHRRERFAGWFPLVIVVLFSPTIVLGEPVERVFQAGTAKVDITPKLGGWIIGGWEPIPAERVHDSLHVKCVVLDNGQARLAFMVCDNLGIPRQVFDEAKRRISDTTGIPEQCQVMSATHTHSSVSAGFDNRYAPDMQLTEYQMRLVEAMVQAAEAANGTLQPAQIGWSSIDVPEHVFNRRWFMKPDTPTPNPFGGTDLAVMNPGQNNPNLDRPAGPIDPEVSFLSVRSVDGNPIALLANYSLHYVGGVVKGELSADYFSLFGSRVMELIADGKDSSPMVGIMTNGTSGDINNIHFGIKTERRPAYEQMQYVAYDLANRVAEAERQMTYHNWVPLAGADAELVLKNRQPTAEQLARAKLVSERGEEIELYHPHEPTYARRVLQMQQMPPTQNIVLTSVRIGDLGIVTIPFEVLVEIGLELKQRSPLGDTLVISLAGGSGGYLPNPKQHAYGGYETWLGTNVVEKQASVKIVEALLKLLKEVADS